MALAPLFRRNPVARGATRTSTAPTAAQAGTPVSWLGRLAALLRNGRIAQAPGHASLADRIGRRVPFS